MTTLKALHESVEDLSRQLRLPAFRQHFIPLAQAAAGAGQTHEGYLLELLKVELDERIERRKKQRLRRCGLPYKRYLSELVREELPTDGQAKIGLLERLDFIAAGQNVILSGNPGTGKTHIAIGLAIQACQEDLNVLFTSVPQLLTQIRESRSQKTLRTLESRFEKYDLVVCPRRLG